MLEPYYKTNNGELYHSDCIKVIPFLENVDLFLTGLPYGINENNKQNLFRVKSAQCQDYGEYKWDKGKIDPVYLCLVKYIRTNQIILVATITDQYLVMRLAISCGTRKTIKMILLIVN